MLAINSRQFWAVFWTKLGYNLRSEVSRTYLGYLWWLIEPVLFVTTMYIVFAILLRIRTDDFLVFLELPVGGEVLRVEQSVVLQGRSGSGVECFGVRLPGGCVRNRRRRAGNPAASGTGSPAGSPVCRA